MTLSPRIRDRLQNWKFSTALQFAQQYNDETGNVTEDEMTTLEALAGTLGNSGWIIDGSLSDVIRAAVAWLLGQPLDASPDWRPLADDAKSRSKAIHPSTGRYGQDQKLCNDTQHHHHQAPRIWCA